MIQTHKQTDLEHQSRGPLRNIKKARAGGSLTTKTPKHRKKVDLNGDSHKKETTTKKFRLASKSFFLTYPKHFTNKEGIEIAIEVSEIQNELEEIFKNREILTFIIAEEESDSDTPYEHFHVFIEVKYKKNIISPDRLDIKGIHGNYQSARNKKQVIDYISKGEKIKYIVGSKNKTILDEIESPFERFCFLTKYEKEDPHLLLRQAIESETFDRFLFEIQTDYFKSPEKYIRVLENRSQQKTKKLEPILIREDIKQQLTLWAQEKENKDTSRNLFIYGKSGTRKTSLVRIITAETFLEIKHLDQAKKFNRLKHKGIFFDDTNFGNRSREELLALIDPDAAKPINVKNSMIEIPMDIPVIIASNFDISKTFNIDKSDTAFYRRLLEIQTDDILTEKDIIPAVYKKSEFDERCLKDLHISKLYSYIHNNITETITEQNTQKITSNTTSNTGCSNSRINTSKETDKLVTIPVTNKQGDTNHHLSMINDEVYQANKRTTKEAIDKNPEMIGSIYYGVIKGVEEYLLEKDETKNLYNKNHREEKEFINEL